MAPSREEATLLSSKIGGGPHGLAFNDCCKSYSFLMVVTCRKENNALKNCLSKWYQDEDFKNICTEEYLNERSEFRRTGIYKKRSTQR